MRVSLIVATVAFLRLCGGDAPPPAPPGMPGAMPGMPGMPGAVPGPVAGAPGMPGMPGVPMPGMPVAGTTPVGVPTGTMPIGTVPGMPMMPGMPGVPMPGMPAVPAMPTPVTEVAAGPHQGTLLTTASAKFEILVGTAGDVKVYVSDPAGAAIPPAEVVMPMLTFEGAPTPTVVALHAGTEALEGTASPAPAASAVVRFDAVVRGTSLPGITATLTAAAAPATATATPEAPAPAPATPEAAPAPPAPAAVAEPSPPAAPAQPAAPRPGKAPTKRPSNAAAPGGRHGVQAQTFAPQPLAPSSNPVRGNVAGGNNPQPAQVQPSQQRPRVVVTPGAGVISN